MIFLTTVLLRITIALLILSFPIAAEPTTPAEIVRHRSNRAKLATRKGDRPFPPPHRDIESASPPTRASHRTRLLQPPSAPRKSGTSRGIPARPLAISQTLSFPMASIPLERWRPSTHVRRPQEATPNPALEHRQHPEGENGGG